MYCMSWHFAVACSFLDREKKKKQDLLEVEWCDIDISCIIGYSHFWL